MDRFEEYKFFAEHTHRLSERRQATTSTYLTVNTGIIAIFALLVREGGFRGWGMVIVSAPLFLVGALACYAWLQIIMQHKLLIRWRYEQLRQMESSPDLAGSHQFFTKEANEFYNSQGSRWRLAFSDLESLLPRLFLVLYLVYAIGILLAAMLGWN